MRAPRPRPRSLAATLALVASTAAAVTVAAPLAAAPLAAAPAPLAVAPRDSTSRPAPDPAHAPVVLTVRNDAWDPIDLYLSDGLGTVRRVGWAPSNATTTLTLPSALLPLSGTPRLIAVPLASSARPSSGPMVIDPGDRLDVRLGPTEDALWVLPSRR